MSFPAVVIRKVLSVFRLIFSCLKSVFGRVCGWRSRSSNIAELPYTMPANLRVDNVNSRHIGAAPSAIDFGSRHGSSVEEPSSIELKIAEYRQQKHNEASMEAASVNEPDFFNEMEPQLKPTKKLKLRDLTRQADNAANTIFQVRDNATRLLESPDSTRLGELDVHSSSRDFDTRESFWDESALPDESELDALAREQRRVEREARQRERVAEHERRLAEKRQQQQIANANAQAARIKKIKQ